MFCVGVTVSRSRFFPPSIILSVALFFFPGVGVVDDQVGQGELAGCFRGGNEAVDGLCFPGERVGGCTTPRGGQGDVPVFVRVGTIQHRAPPLWGCVVVADQIQVGVQIHALGPD